MSQGNQTSTVTEFFIVGFPGLLPKYYDLLGTVFFLIYVATLTGNTVFLTLFVIEQSLQKPMYLIMVNLALCDIGFCTVALPKIISRYWFNAGAISFHLCFFQRQLIHYFGTLNSLIMLIMALDRYVAICFPLRYPMLMTNKVMGLLTGFAWSTAMISPGITTIMSSQLPFCGPNLILNCYCDTISVNRLACTDTSQYERLSFSLAMFVLLLPFFLIIVSYINVIIAVLRSRSTQARLKTFSTCVTQICIISIYYIPRFVVYLTTYIPNIKLNIDSRIALTMLYSLMPPVVNPVIYCFRTKEIRRIFMQWCISPEKV
ncbi:olfactory receptor 52E8-like [Scleropages formosus]|uniref:olfactory receptor 52E8-like n=1 Tax=Scleropages formosus TaxID=113540 RepID=UPI0010FA6E73|nr:olfactory receptor 52E8-like [Scleropages formosus]